MCNRDKLLVCNGGVMSVFTGGVTSGMEELEPSWNGRGTSIVQMVGHRWCGTEGVPLTLHGGATANLERIVYL